jgi:MarR family transcriptional regulator, transcriptional regulator for hemolysin
MLTILMPNLDTEPFGLLLHGTARAWRLKLDGRLKPMGLSQAKWRTLLHLSIASGPLTQAEVASRLGIEEPTLVTLLHRLERGGWVTRRNASHDRRCKTVHLGKRAHQVITRINAAAAKLRHELLDDIPPSQLLICMRVLGAIRDKAEREDGGRGRVRAARNGQTRNGHAIMKSRAPRRDGK